MTQRCGATLPRVNDPNWECTGRDLIVVTHVVGLPVVLPARALDVIEPEDWWDSPVKRFEGGDHAHLVVPRRPPPRDYRPDTVICFGDAAMAAMDLGTLINGGTLSIGVR